MFGQGGAGFWTWDLPWQVGTKMEDNGGKWRVFYCPGTSVRFSEQDNWNLWNYAPNNYRVLGYAMTFAGTAGLAQTNWNRWISKVDPVQVGFGVTYTEPLSHRVLLADTTMSQPGQANPMQRSTYDYTTIVGGFAKPHMTSHLSGKQPSGGNVAMLDGHAEWRKWEKMTPRTTGGSPVFWW